MTARRLVRDASGATAAEFALVLPLLLLMIFAVIDVGRFMWEYNRAEKATQVGVRVAAVTDVIPSGLAAATYLGVGGLTQGDPIPASALGLITCSKPAAAVTCSCTTPTCPGTLTPIVSASFDAIVARMKRMKPDITGSNVHVEYRGSGLGFAGDPNGMEVSPLVTVRLSGLNFVPITSLLFATITMPDLSSTLTAEDSAGTQSN